MGEKDKKIPLSVGSSIVLSAGILLGGTAVTFGTIGTIQVEASGVSYETTANLNLRGSASTSGKILLTIPKGKQVIYISESGSWFKVKYGSNEGWVSSSYLKKANAANQVSIPPATMVYQATANLNMRSTASTKGKLLTTIPKGKEITYISKQGSWYNIKYGNQTGWVSASYVKVTAKSSPAPTPSAPQDNTGKSLVATSNVNLRNTSSTSGKILTTIPKDKEITYISRQGDWYNVSYGNQKGWVSASYVKEMTPTPATPTPVPTPAAPQENAGVSLVATSNVNLRNTSSTSGKILTTIPKNKEIMYISKQGDWYNVSYGNQKGWVSASYVKEMTPTPAAPTPAVPQENAGVSLVATSNVNLRNTSSTSGKILTTIPKDKEITYISKQGDWYNVSYGNQKGWVSASYVKEMIPTTPTPTPEASTPAPETVIPAPETFGKYWVVTASLNLRDDPSISGKILTTIPEDKEITYISKRGDWYNVKYGNQTGWVSAGYVKEIDKITTEQPVNGAYFVTTANLNMRDQTSASGKVILVIPQGTVLTSISKKDGWHQVSYQGRTGYVSSSYLSETTKENFDTKTLMEQNNPYIMMDLRTSSSVTASHINQYLANNGVTAENSVLYNSGQLFIDAANKYGVNALYLAAHAIHESGYGKSTIAKAKNNLFGFGAYDLVPFVGAVKYSTIASNIDYIAQEMKATYLNPNNWKYRGAYLGYTVKNQYGSRVDALSIGMNYYYASDSDWGLKIAKHMEGILSASQEAAFNQQPNTQVPNAPGYPSGKDVFPNGTLAVANASIPLYNALGSSTQTATISKGEKFNLLEKSNNYWLTLGYNGRTYYTNKVSFSSYNKSFTVKNLARVNSATLNVRESVGTNATKIATLSQYQYVELVLNNNLTPVIQTGWYKIKLNDGRVGWVSGDFLIRELNR